MTEFNAHLVALSKLSSHLQHACEIARDLAMTELADQLYHQGHEVAKAIGKHVVSHSVSAVAP